ncbi:60S ribosomal export protein NMD3-like [Chenopodium quinoa]|uniref:60S ribosomal export protein NMD3-like n=1 Tax=Chenopodium quinoa TaxID=63459 RepID=UPI000B7778AE|nr:60S ribosomal export protein NMD3-like [Chenopodium quinoa]
MEKRSKKTGVFVNFRTKTIMKKKTIITTSQLFSRKQISLNLSISQFLREVDDVDKMIKSVTSKEKTWTVNRRDITEITSCCKCCGFLLSQSDTDIHMCKSYRLSEDPTKKLPRYYIIRHCQVCQSYSYAGTKSWHKFPPGESSSISLLRFLLEKLGFYFRVLRLMLIDAWLVQPNDHTTVISLVLKVQFEGPDGSRLERKCDVVFTPAYMNCPSCSDLIDETQLSYVVQLRQYASQDKTFRAIKLRVLTTQPTLYNIKKMKLAKQGVDFLFATRKDAENLYNFLLTQTPIKPDQFRKKSMKSSDPNSNNHTEIWYISAVICPIYLYDLIHLPQSLIASHHVGPLVICISSYKFIRVIDHLTLTRCQIRGNDYWKEPFEPLKTSSELVEYKVLDVEIVLSEQLYSLANVKVARASDIGKNGTESLVKTHLGNVLKRGDYVLGYELCSTNYSADVEMENSVDTLPNVVLIKKKSAAAELNIKVTRQKASPEYQQFLGDLENNPEAMFNLSLNEREGENQTSEMVSMKPDNSELELEELLADLDLSDEQEAKNL